MNGFLFNIKSATFLFIALLPSLVFSAESLKLGCMMCHQGQHAHLMRTVKKNDQRTYVRNKNS